MLTKPRDFAILVVLAIGIGLVLARVAPPRAAATPTPTPVARTETPTITPSPVPTDDPRVWEQPLVAGCADGAGAFLFSLGGGIGYYDGQTWGLVDETLRRLRAATCTPGLAIAVGDGDRLVRVDASQQTVRPDTLGPGDTDLLAVGARDARSIVAAGTQLVVWRLVAGNWESASVAGADVAWHAAYARSDTEVWLAGDAGTIGVFDGKAMIDRSLQNGPDLTALLPWSDLQVLIGSADGRLFTASLQAAPKEVAKVKGAVRGLVPARGGAYVLADDIGTFGDVASPPPSGLQCPAVSIFGTGKGDLWVIARDESRAGVARFDGAVWTKWGRC